MAKSSPYLTWCEVTVGDDNNWWVKEISDEIHWDLDALSIIDPKQISHILDLVEPLREYGLQTDLLETAFYSFTIDNETKDGLVRLSASTDSLLDSDEPLFGLPDILDEEKGPYADFINHVTRLRVKMLNEVIDFDQPLTVDEVEDEIREKQNNDFMEGRCTHLFNEICDILEYTPHGYELDSDTDEAAPRESAEKEYEEDIPDVEEDNEKIEEDETMRWGDEEELSEDESEENIEK